MGVPSIVTSPVTVNERGGTNDWLEYDRELLPIERLAQVVLDLVVAPGEAERAAAHDKQLAQLKELETRILSAEDKMLRLEARLFDEVREKALDKHATLLRLADGAAPQTIREFDLARLARRRAIALHEELSDIALSAADGGHRTAIIDSLDEMNTAAANAPAINADMGAITAGSLTLWDDASSFIIICTPAGA